MFLTSEDIWQHLFDFLMTFGKFEFASSRCISQDSVTDTNKLFTDHLIYEPHQGKPVYAICKQARPGSLDVRQAGTQEVAGSIIRSGNILS